METKNSDEIEIDLRELFGLLMSRIWILILAAVIGVGSVGLICKYLITPIYSSTTQLCILSSQTTLSSLADLQVGTQLTQDYIVVAQSRPVVDKVIENLKLDYTYEELLANVTMENPTDTRILTITVQDHDPYMAKQIADQFADISKKRIAELMDIAEPGIIEEGHVAENKTSPKTMQNALVGGIVAVLLAMAVIIIRYLMDDTIKSSEDIEKYLGLNTLALLPFEESGVDEEEREKASEKRRKKEHRKRGNAS